MVFLAIVGFLPDVFFFPYLGFSGIRKKIGKADSRRNRPDLQETKVGMGRMHGKNWKGRGNRGL